MISVVVDAVVVEVVVVVAAAVVAVVAVELESTVAVLPFPKISQYMSVGWLVS